MTPKRKTPGDIDQYVASFPPDVQAVLERVRRTVRAAAPDAQEAISYGMPTFTLHGVLVHFGAFKGHIGLYPPVRGDAELEELVHPYAGEKGNLRFPLDRPVPYDLIERIVRLRVQQNLVRAASKGIRSA